MALSGVNKNKLLLKPFSVSGLWCMSRLARPFEVKSTKREAAEAEEERRRRREEGGGWWMPDPRTGIYFPRGQEWVMDDVPTHAASFDCTFWLRNVVGVDSNPTSK